MPGGCAGYWRHRGFSFDVGATTLVDFEPGGVGGELLDAVGHAAGSTARRCPATRPGCPTGG